MLVCTTIIESGIDMPTVNTLVVDRADLLGLGQLHQLRGRVGRAGQRAYAYLFFPPDRALTEEAYERLKTIGEHDRARLAASRSPCATSRSAAPATCSAPTSRATSRPSATTSTCQMVSEAVAELKGEEPREPAEIKLDLPVDANLPKDYVAREESAARGVPPPGRGHHRTTRSTTSAPSGSTATGRCPAAAEALLDVGRLRAECVRTGVREVTVAKSVARLSPLTLKAVAGRCGWRAWPRGRSTRRISPKARRALALRAPIRPALALVESLHRLVGERQ